MGNRVVLLAFILSFLSQLALLAKDDKEHDLIYEMWQREFVKEVADVDNPKREFDCILHTLRSSNKFSHSKDYLYPLCRKLVRLAYTDELKNHVRYPYVLKVLSNHFWEEHSDTLMSLILLLESNRLLFNEHITDDNVGAIHSDRSAKLLSYFKNEREAYLQVFWLASYLFGRHGTATRMLCELCSSYYDRNNYLKAHFYFNRATLWKNASLNDASTNIAYMMARELNITEKLRKRDLLYLESVYQSDPSEDAQKSKLKFLHLFENEGNGDIVSAYYFRELGIDYIRKSDFSYATYYLNRAVKDYSSSILQEKDSLYFANTHYLLGVSQRKLGNNQRAKKYFLEAVNISKDYKELCETYIFSKIELAKVMLDLGELFSAAKTIAELGNLLLYEDGTVYLDFLPEIGFDFRNRKQCLSASMIMFMQLKGISLINEDDDRALSCLMETQQLMERDIMHNSSFYYNNKIKLARQYIRLNIMDTAEKELNNCISAYKKKKKITITDVIDAYTLLGQISCLKKDHNKAIQYYKTAIEALIEYATEHMFTMAESERAQFIENVKPVIGEIQLQCLIHSKDDTLFTGIALNCSIFLKGLLLFASNVVRNAVYDLQDDSLISTYEHFMSHKNSNIFLQQIESSNTQQEELNLLHHSKIAEQIDNKKQELKFNYKHVQNQLRKDEIAVEFITIDKEYEHFSIKTKDKQYWAIIVTRDGGPYSVPLFCENEINKFSLQLDEKIYEKVWKPLETHIKHAKKLFFSPTGILYNYPIESSTCFVSNTELSNTKLLRVSSLREIVYQKHQLPDNVALYGGLDYNLGENVRQVSNLKAQKHRPYRDITEFLNTTRGAIETLPGSEEEVDNIDRLLRKNNYHSTLYKHDYGTEHSFKSLSGEDISVVHLSTHGFVDIQEEGSFNELAILSHASLWLSGAADNIGKKSVTLEDDGILRASEIMSLDFRRLALVVLSACNSGLGSVTSDGVFGLQRGFKKAGAQSILMSLWKVDDEATCLLMTEFYKNWITQKMTKYNALEAAKQTVRNHKEKGWDNPKYWAAFILLDGLD